MTSVPGMAAITLDPRGGGVATVSRLLSRVLVDEWGDRCRVVTLVPPGATSLETTTPERVAFGARVAWAQAQRGCPWMLFTHLAIARTQAYVPMPVRRPYAIFLHGIESWRPLSPSQERVLRGASVLLVNSSYTARRVRAEHPWLPVPRVCPLALESPVHLSSSTLDVSSSTERGPDHPWGPHAVLLVGRMAATERYKGHDELLDAWPSVVADVPDARLVFVGEGDDRTRLRERAQSLGVGASFVTTGFLDAAALDAAYRSAAVFAMPSRNEGFGLVYLEAMARGLPCIGSVLDAAAEVIDEGGTGYLVDQRDVGELSLRLIRLLRDRSLRQEMGARGRQRALQRFGYSQFRDRVVAALHGAFDEVLAVPALASRTDERR
jgi:phosphatidylinositol alpha-1,6-mannosyltransferase